MSKQNIIILLAIFSLSTQPAFSGSQTVTATLSESPSGGGTGKGGGFPAGAVVGISLGGGAASGATAFAFAPVLLAGLEPNTVICASAPLENINPRANYLEKAIKEQGGVKISKNGIVKSGDKFYFAQNDCEIINGTYDIDEIRLPGELKSASKLKVNITIVSDSYSVANGEPELVLGIYKDITRLNLNKKFETQQFLHHYLMKKYDTPLKITNNDYSHGIQKMFGIIDMTKLQFRNQPLQVAIRYTQGGFRSNLRKENPKVLTYAYLIEFSK